MDMVQPEAFENLNTIWNEKGKMLGVYNKSLIVVGN